MKIREEEYYKELLKIARDAAKERAKFNASMNETAYSQDDEDKLYQAYAKKLENKYPYAYTDEFYNRFSKLKNASASDLANWMMGGGELNTFNDEYDPERIAKKAEMEKFLPLIAGIAEPGKDWLSTSGEALRDKAASNEFNYKRKEFPEFLDKLREYQTQYDRAKILDEARNTESAKYILGKLISPSYMQEAENAILTGEGGDPETLDKLKTVDYLANVATALMPSNRLLKNVYANGVLNAAMQGGAEAWRQYEKAANSKAQGFESAPVLGSAIAGLTVPGLVGSVQQVASRIPGESSRQFSRGLMKSTRYGDPVFNERNRIESILREVNGFPRDQRIASDQLNALRGKIQRIFDGLNKDRAEKGLGALTDTEKLNIAKSVTHQDNDKFIMGLIKGTDDFNSIYTLDELSRLEQVPYAEKVVKFLGNDLMNDDNTINVAKAIERYDDPVAALVKRSGSGFERLPKDEYKVGGVPYLSSKNVKEGSKYLTKEDLETYQQLFPAKYEDMISKSGARKGGEYTGAVLSAIGGRAEPVLKINPFNIDSKTGDFLSSDQFKDIEERSPEAAEIIKKAFQKKKKKDKKDKKLDDESKKILEEVLKAKSEE